MSQTTLKIIAVLAMLIDHAGAVLLLPIATQGEMVELYWITRYIGRTAFPIFAYLVAVGCAHTKNIKAYALRLALFALLSQIPFDLAFGNEISFIAQTNVFYTLFLGVLSIALFKTLGSRLWMALLVLPPSALAAELLGTDFGAFGVILIFILYVAKPLINLHAALIVATFMVYLYFGSVGFLVFGLAAAVCIFFNNGKRALRQPLGRYGFYAFYPAHLAFLWALANFL